MPFIWPQLLWYNGCEIGCNSIPRYGETRITMTEIVTAVYENGLLRPLEPLDLRERQRVRIQVLPENGEG